MATNALVVDISAKLHVDRATAEGCLALASIYMNDNGLTVFEKTNKDGTIALEFTEREHTW